MSARVPTFVIGGEAIERGTRRTVDLPISVLPDHTRMTLSVHAVRGAKPGPTLFISAAIHGDEIIGVEIVRRLMQLPHLNRLTGTLLLVPILNGYGFIAHSRYLPDRRDLNRSFPGNPNGSLAGQIAHMFLNEVVKKSDFGIDLHSAAIHRFNLPQIRLSPSGPETNALAEAFGAPIILTSPVRDQSMRQAGKAIGVDILVFEAGEGLRFDELSIRAGVAGILRVMKAMGMISSRGVQANKFPSVKSESSYWVRAPSGGLLRAQKTIGETIDDGAVIGSIGVPLGERDMEVNAKEGGLIIGRTNLPVVNQGDALFHIARISHPGRTQARIEGQEAQLQADPLFDEDEIV